jgi:hypothetical protein
MPFHRALVEQLDPEAVPTPVDAVEVVPVPPAEIELAALRLSNAALVARVAELEAAPPETWLALKAAAHDSNMIYETLRSWAVNGLITARREGDGRLFVDIESVKARQRRLGARK